MLKYKLIIPALLSALIFTGACQHKTQSAEYPEIIPADSLGQLIIAGFRGSAYNESETLQRWLRETAVGGVIYFPDRFSNPDSSRNIQNPTQLLQLSGDIIQKSVIPPMIAVNQGGSRMNAFSTDKEFPETRLNQQLGVLNSPDSVIKYIRPVAQEFMVTGVNTNFGPVVNYPASGNFNAEMYLPADPVIHKNILDAILAEYETEGILIVPKYFPRPGASLQHAGMEFNPADSLWSDDDLNVFIDLLKGLEIHAIQMGSAVYPEKYGSEPASLNKGVIEGLLRDSLSFEGVVISDFLHNPYYLDRNGLEGTIEKSLNAGVDMLLLENFSVYDDELAENAINIIQKLMHGGRVDSARVREAMNRVARLKENVIADLCTCLNF